MKLFPQGLILLTILVAGCPSKNYASHYQYEYSSSFKIVNILFGSKDYAKTH
ncbi:MAG: hypothetical protein ACHQJ6_03975 [Candidatus Berkiellales bacterium]